MLSGTSLLRDLHQQSMRIKLSMLQVKSTNLHTWAWLVPHSRIIHLHLFWIWLWVINLSPTSCQEECTGHPKIISMKEMNNDVKEAVCGSVDVINHFKMEDKKSAVSFGLNQNWWSGLTFMFHEDVDFKRTFWWVFDHHLLWCCLLTETTD